MKNSNSVSMEISGPVTVTVNVKASLPIDVEAKFVSNLNWHQKPLNLSRLFKFEEHFKRTTIDEESIIKAIQLQTNPYFVKRMNFRAGDSLCLLLVTNWFKVAAVLVVS